MPPILEAPVLLTSASTGIMESPLCFRTHIGTLNLRDKKDMHVHP